ncbi:hypothetical protein [Xenorhabdus hominickii]|uniref:Uncharacterized protein n=1 Tax=Xenorhabdus hominickii TaxID=351679 RepID=A0A1V0M453_XENHO|nr:hypothetical protein [Xenorhabdus hominickii]ARD69630.1 hypothetical protein [Xenorhabdus hominickii]PHM52344.1 hypothetical protein Xhom_04421 [Xenorhabdus hominickii]
MFEEKMYRQTINANMSFLSEIPKEKAYLLERMFYIRSAAQAKRALIKLNEKVISND